MNIEQGQTVAGSENLPLETLEAMSPKEVQERVTKMLTPEQKERFFDTDFELVAAIARRLLNSPKPDTVDDALGVATEIRLEARQALGSVERNTFVQDREGQVIAGGIDKADAEKRAKEAAGQ
jgi:hypothetical protein